GIDDAQDVTLRAEPLLHARDFVEAHLFAGASAAPPAEQGDVRIEIAAGARIEHDRRRALHYLIGSRIRAWGLIDDLAADVEVQQELGVADLGTLVVVAADRVGGAN